MGVLLLTLLGCTLSARCDTNTLWLSQGSETDYVIYISPDAAQTSKNAAQELSTFLKQTTQATFPIVSFITNETHVIAVGPLAAKSVAPQLDLSKTGDTGLGDDGIVIKVIDSHHLVLTGAEGAKRGTLYAVYEFLEREVGVRWWTENASFVPNTPDLSIGALDVRYRPVFDYREALYRYLQGLSASEGTAAQNRAKFIVRQRFNGHYSRIPAEWGGSYSLLGWCHTFYELMPPETYFKEHPEWYSEINGKRVHHAGAQLCCTDESMIEELTRNVLKRIRANPDAGIISVSQNDSGGGYCECARCKAMDDAEGSHAGSLLYCVNKVAEAVEKEFPEFKVETLAYLYTSKPPKTIHPRKNVLIRRAVIERSGGQPIDSEINHAIMEDLQTWKTVAPSLFIWDYCASQTAGYTPNPSLQVYAPDLRTYAENNVRGVFFEGNYSRALGSFDYLKTYVISHAMWNPYVDENDIIDDFLNGYYGEAAAQFLRQYLDLLATKGKWIKQNENWSTPLDAEWMDLATMNEATTLFNQAEIAVAGDPALLKRVRYARLGIDHQWLRGYQRYREDGGPFNGPTNLVVALEDFLVRAKEAVPGERIGMKRNDDYETALRDHVEAILHPAAVPEALSDIPADRIIDFQPHQFWLVPSAAQILNDSAASGGKAVKIDPLRHTWAAQAISLNEHGIDPGLYRIYARIRCEKTSDFGDNTETGIAFTGAVYNPNGKGASLSTRLERTGEWSQKDPPIVQLSQGGAVDGQYHLYDLGAHDLKPGARVWFGTAGLVPAECVKAVYIDRLIFVKE